MSWNGSGPPAFQLYATDWLMSTRLLPPEARGIYLDLLCLSWDQDGIPEDPTELLPLLAISKAKWKRIWPLLEDKWPLAEKGRRRNPRQEAQRQEYVELREKRAAAGRASAKARASK